MEDTVDFVQLFVKVSFLYLMINCLTYVVFFVIFVINHFLEGMGDTVLLW